MHCTAFQKKDDINNGDDAEMDWLKTIERFSEICIIFYFSYLLFEEMLGTPITMDRIFHSFKVTISVVFTYFLTNFLPVEISGDAAIPLGLVIIMLMEGHRKNWLKNLYCALLSSFVSISVIILMPKIAGNLLPWPFMNYIAGAVVIFLIARFRLLAPLYIISIHPVILLGMDAGFLYSILIARNGDLSIYIILWAGAVTTVLFLVYQLGACFQLKKTKKESYQNLLLYSRELEHLNDELSAFKHDYINLLLTMEESIRKEDMAELSDIFYSTVYPSREKIENRQNSIQKYAKIRLIPLRNLLITKELCAKKIGITFHWQVIGIIDKIDVDMTDLIRTLSILIDNAMEAAQQASGEKIIRLSLMKAGEDLSFSCQNSTAGLDFDRRHFFDKYYSTKEDGACSHGLGLYSLNQILDKNPCIHLSTTFGEDSITQTINAKSLESSEEEEP